MQAVIRKTQSLVKLSHRIFIQNLNTNLNVNSALSTVLCFVAVKSFWKTSQETGLFQQVLKVHVWGMVDSFLSNVFSLFQYFKVYWLSSQ